MQNSQIERSKAVVAGFIQTHALRSLTPQSFVFIDKQVSAETFTTFLQEIKTPDMVRFKVWDSDYRVIYSDYEPIIGQKFPENKELRQALSGNVSAWIGVPNDDENIGELQYEELLEVYIPIVFNDSTLPVGAIETYFDLKAVNILLAKIKMLIFIGVFFVVAIIFMLAWFLFRYLIRSRLTVLVQAAHEIAGGNLGVQVKIKGTDEINDLAEAFNYMASKLNEMYEGLECKVKDRTQELAKENKLMVGRELKMIELKKEIEELKTKLNKQNNKTNNE